MFLFLPKLWELFTQIERSQQRLGGIGIGVGGSGGGGGGDGSDSNSIDGFIYNGNGGWVNSSGNLAALAQGSAAAAAAAASGGSGSMNDGSQYLSGQRKGSIGTLDESKGETLKETHMGYMGVKFQNRWVPFLSSWCMRRVILYPTGRYFTCFELVSLYPIVSYGCIWLN